MRWILYLWTSPNTLFGLFIILITRGKISVVDGNLEAHSPGLRWLLSNLPMPARAMTLGHVIIGVNQRALRVTRLHEQVHVRQYERWGPLFIPAYLTCSAYLWMKGRNAYRDNPFEVEAFAVDEPGP
ncbi:MAG: hypothetical protein AAFP90_22675 [Planctomycetota bacterium]